MYSATLAGRALGVVIALGLGLGCSPDTGSPHGAANGGNTNTGGMAGNSTGGVGTGGVGVGAGGDGQVGPRDLVLPIEVLGTGDPTAPTIVATKLLVAAADVASAEKLYVRCHRCGAYAAPPYKALAKPVTKVKASLRVVGDASKPEEQVPWIDVTDANVVLDEMAASHGGINGAMVVVGFTVVLDGAARARLTALPVANTIEFRFNGTDGDSNGYRVLDLELRDAAGRNVSSMTKRWADISAEKEAGKVATADAQEGAALWQGHGILQESPIVNRKLHAACASCHASDGRDLQYFNYSNNSIVRRSQFHGLSEEQGRQIVAYLRSSLHGRVPHVRQAAPWNPPYQPGPGLDDGPVHEWAAGAGIDAVLATAESFAKAFVGAPIDGTPLALSQTQIDAVMDPNGTIDIRNTPIALELPDWNAWLPNLHPLDVWTPENGQTKGLFETQGDEGRNPLKVVARIAAWLEAHKNPNGVYGDWTHLTPDERGQASAWLGDVGSKTADFGGGSRGTRESSDPSKPFGCQIGAAKLEAQTDATTIAQFPAKAYSRQAFIERVNFGLYRWMIVQQWALAHTYGLEGDQRQLAGQKDQVSKQWIGEGEERGWLYRWPSLFYVAPHILHAPEGTGNQRRENYFAWEPKVDSLYRTNQWYQLQMILNPGFPGASRGPMDWPYHLGFIEALADAIRDTKRPPRVAAAHLLRFFQARAKLSQLANTDIPFDAPDPRDPMNLHRNQGIQSRADLLNKLSPTGVLPKRLNEPKANRYVELDSIMPGLHLIMLNGSISLYNGFFAGSDVSKFRRCDPNNTSLGGPEQKSGFRFCVDVARTPLPLDDRGNRYLPWSWDQWTTEQYATWGVLASKALGAEPGRLAIWDAWNHSIWPE